MTLPDERFRAVMYTRDFLRSLCDPKQTPRVPANVRDMARRCLRHYPDTYEMQEASEAAPHVFQERMEDVTRMFAVYERNKLGHKE